MDYILVISSFISGTLIATIAAYANQKVKQTSEDKLRLRESEYQIYLKLNDLYQWYFWFSTNELHQEKTDKMVYLECNRIALSIAQELHKNEKSEFTKDLLKILYDESIPTFDER